MADASIANWSPAQLRAFIQTELRGDRSTETPAPRGTVIEQFGGLDMPVGTILSFAGIAATSNDTSVAVDPPGWFVCDGRVFKRAEYAALAQILGDAYDDAELYIGTENFVIPDLKHQALLGQDNYSPGSALGVLNPPGVVLDMHNGSTTPTYKFRVVTFFIKH